MSVGLSTAFARAARKGYFPNRLTDEGRFTQLSARICFLALTALSVAGCLPIFGEPSRSYTVEDQLPPLALADGTPTFTGVAYQGYLGARTQGDQKFFRNEFITAQMSTIDMAYTRYETGLTNEVDVSGFVTTAASLGLTTAATAVTAAETKTLLSGIATVVTGTDAAFNQKVLVSKTIQNIQTQMRKDRHDQAAIILANMRCPVEIYPLGMALSDLELYRRAGTFSSGLIGVANTVNKAEANAKANKDSQTPGGGGGANDLDIDALINADLTKLQSDLRKRAGANKSDCTLQRPSEALARTQRLLRQLQNK